MLLICDNKNEKYLFLQSGDLINIINNFESQTAIELFDGYEGMTSNYINGNYIFHYIATNINELKLFVSFFNKFKLTDNQLIKLKIMDITQEDLDHFLYEYRHSSVINRLLIDVAFDKSGDFIDTEDFDQMRYIIHEVKQTIPKDATNLEIITYVYNWLKKREYKHNDEYPYLSKCYSTALLTEYIVCVGFTRVFNNILSEYGISASEYQYYLLVDDNDKGHDISIVKIQDKKYGVDGLYFFDLTKDCYNPKNEDNYKYSYSGFMMTYDEITKDNITKDMFNKMLLWDNADIQATIDVFKPIVDSFTYDDDIEYFDENMSEQNIYLITNLLRIENDLFNKEKTVDIFCLGNPDGAMYFICNYILFLKSRLGKKVKDSTIIDLLINTINTNNSGDYLKAINSYNPTNDYNNPNLEKQYQYIKKRLENKND